jgi:hypothetical protein
MFLRAGCSRVMEAMRTAEPVNDAILPSGLRPIERARARSKLPVAAAALAGIGLGAGGYGYLTSRGTPEPPAAARVMAPPALEAPHNVPPNVLEQHRIRTDRVEPDAATRAEMASAKVARVVGAFKVCVDATGAVATIHKLKSTGFAAYDRTIEEELRGRRYRPIEIDGKPSAICTAQTFTYRLEPSREE